MLIDQIITAVTPAADHTVTEVSLGVGYTAVCLDNGSCGVAYTFRNELGSRCSVLGEAGTITGRSAGELLSWAKDTNLARAAIGLATINAVCPPCETESGNAISAVDIRPSDQVGMIGYLHPIVQTLKQRKQSVLIFEREPRREDVLPDWAVEMELDKCSVVIITATTMLNKTIDRLLYLSRNAREVAIIGPSVPLLPDVFSNYGVTLLGGVRVVDSHQLLRVTAEGGGARSFGSAAVQVYTRISEVRS